MGQFEVGLGITWSWWRIKFGWARERFEWGWPGEIENGKSSPAEYFRDAVADEYWIWGWLGFVVFFSRTRAFY